jgi:hypothetical protein
MRRAIVSCFLVGLSVALCSCKPAETVLSSQDGTRSIIVPSRYVARSALPVLVGKGDSKANDLLLAIPVSELKIQLAADPLVYIFEPATAPVTRKHPEAVAGVPTVRKDGLVRCKSKDDLALVEPVVDPRSGEVVALCPVAIEGLSKGMCRMTRFSSGPFQVEVSIMDEDLAQYRVVQKGIGQWLQERSKAGD